MLKNFKVVGVATLLWYSVQVQYCARAQISLPVSPPQCTFKIKSCLKVFFLPDPWDSADNPVSDVAVKSFDVLGQQVIIKLWKSFISHSLNLKIQDKWLMQNLLRSMLWAPCYPVLLLWHSILQRCLTSPSLCIRQFQGVATWSAMQVIALGPRAARGPQRIPHYTSLMTILWEPPQIHWSAMYRPLQQPWRLDTPNKAPCHDLLCDSLMVAQATECYRSSRVPLCFQEPLENSSLLRAPKVHLPCTSISDLLLLLDVDSNWTDLALCT